MQVLTLTMSAVADKKKIAVSIATVRAQAHGSGRNFGSERSELSPEVGLRWVGAGRDLQRQ